MLDILCTPCSTTHTGHTADLSTRVTLSMSITNGMPNIAGRALPVEGFRIVSGRVMSPSAGATWLPILRMMTMKTWTAMPSQEHLRTVSSLHSFTLHSQHGLYFMDFGPDLAIV